ncbi:MAG: hypothetical protein FWG14_06865 [Peptococcaceae bacterium]|nr:hypothetical protein [Peptococcaceae bacterium]
MPEIPKTEKLTCEQTINMILLSIAMEELALSHVLNAEGEKIQQALDLVKCHKRDCDIQKLLDINESVSSMIAQISDLQIILKSKMQLAIKHLSCLPVPSPPQPTPDKPCEPPRPPHRPCPPQPPCSVKNNLAKIVKRLIRILF